MAGIVLFIALLGLTVWFSAKGFMRIRRNVLLGKEYSPDGDTTQRWRNTLLIAFGQQKMFKNWLPALLHGFIYVAFLFTQIELIEILVDGLSGSHRIFAPFLGSVYTLLINSIEILSLLALIATIAFLFRRNLLKIARFQKPELSGWPSRDANIILVGEILLIAGIFSMNGADGVLQAREYSGYPDTGHLMLSSFVGAAFFDGLDNSLLVFIERAGWWLHIAVVFGFMVYLPYSKHLHIVLAFPNTWYARLSAKGKMENMPEVEKEVRSMLGLSTVDDNSVDPGSAEIPEFGAKDVFDLSWKNILDAYSCTECGRCTAACPANSTGKKLSPRKIMMDVRDRADDIGKKMDSGDIQFVAAEKQADGVVPDASNFYDGKSLFDLISPEEIHACTTCNACVEACPVMINPLDIILQLRRHEILSQSAGPADWLPLFNSLENSGAAWSLSEARDAWTKNA
jgi:heterodisulfide reductase subunit C